MPSFLRDAATGSMVAEIASLTEALRTASPAMRGRLLGRRGDLRRVCGEVARAVTDLEEACRLSEADAETHVRNLIRLGTARFYAGDYAAGEADLARALERAPNDRLRGFAHQHLGKCLAEQERYAEARGHFEQALALRTAAGDPELVASSRRALDALPGTK